MRHGQKAKLRNRAFGTDTPTGFGSSTSECFEAGTVGIVLHHTPSPTTFFSHFKTPSRDVPGETRWCVIFDPEDVEPLTEREATDLYWWLA